MSASRTPPTEPVRPGSVSREAAPAAATESLRIGEVAEAAGVSTRTVRYYEQVGLIEPVQRTPGGTRTYTKRDVEVLVRIRELQSVMGFDLDQIRTILRAENRIHELREEWRDAQESQLAPILREAVEINLELRAQVEAKIAILQDFLADLEARAQRHRDAAADHRIDFEELTAGLPGAVERPSI